MKFVLVAVSAAMLSTAAVGQVYVHGYTTKNGTYVAPYYRSAPDHSLLNNYSTRGNVNPYTGQAGTRNPYGSYSSPYVRTAPSQGCLYCSTTQTPSTSSDDEASPY